MFDQNNTSMEKADFQVFCLILTAKDMPEKPNLSGHFDEGLKRGQILIPYSH